MEPRETKKPPRKQTGISPATRRFFRSFKTSNVGAFILIAAVWALLYLPHLRTSPPWYNDETFVHKIAMELVHGKMVQQGLWTTFWHPHNPYQPFYYLLAGVFGSAAGGDLVGSRFLNTLLALACALAIYYVGRRSLGRIPSLFACLMFLTYDQSIIHFRMTYPHNLVGLGILLMTLFLLRPAGLQSDLKAGLGLAFAAGAHPLAVHAAISGALCRLKRPRSLFLLLLPAAIVIGISLGIAFFRNRQWLLDDLTLLKFAYTSRGEADGGGAKALDNLWYFLRQDWFHACLFLGLVVSARKRLYPILVIGGFVLFMLLKNRQNLPVFYYQAIIILPTLCLGWASIFIFVRKWMRRQTRLTPDFRLAGPALLFVLPSILWLTHIPRSLEGKFVARNQYWASQSTAEVEEVAKWLNERTSENDFVPCDFTLAWLLKAKTANYLQVVTWYGYPTTGYDYGNKRERFRYDESLENARYAVVSDNEKKWAFHEKNVHVLVKKLLDEKWPVVWQGKNYLVLENPKHHISLPNLIQSLSPTGGAPSTPPVTRPESASP